MPMEQIEQLTKEHAADRALVAERVQNLNDQMEAAKKRLLPGIKTAVSAAKDSRARLHAMIDDSREQFVRPKSRVFHGIRVGLKRGLGKVTFTSSADDVVDLIRQHLASKFSVLVQTKQKPVKKALAQLPAATLAKVGCEVGAVNDEVVLEPVDGEVDKLVAALLGDARDADDDDGGAGE